MLKIGPLEFEVPFVQAALSGYSDLPMRRLARRYGAPYALNEVVLDKLVLQGGKKRREILEVCEHDHPVGGQLMGANPDEFGPAAAAMVEAGYDVIDIKRSFFFSCATESASASSIPENYVPETVWNRIVDHSIIPRAESAFN